MKIVTKKLSELNPAVYNPRKQLTPENAEYQKLKASIERFGSIDPIVANKDGTIIGGHQRYRVLLDLGYEEDEISEVDLSKEDEKALNIALNKISGEWDNQKLRELLVDLDLSGYDIELTGFDHKELADLIVLTDVEPEVSEDDYDVEEAYKEVSEKKAIVRSGEVWKLGHHRLMCGDATRIDDVKKLMGNELMDLFITDPPYNVNYEEKADWVNRRRTNANSAKEIHNDSMGDDAFYAFLRESFGNIHAYTRNGAAIYVFHADMQGLTFRKAFQDSGLKLSEILIWEKNNFVLGRSDYQWRHEPILYGRKEGAKHYFIKDRTQDTIILEDDIDFESMKKGELVQYIKDLRQQYADQTTVLYEKKPLSSSVHPTMKPLELIAKFMKNSSQRGWNVGDLFGGSGSTLMAAEQLGRNAFVMEIDENYASVIINRWETYTGEKAEKLEE